MQKPLNEKAQQKVIAERLASHKACNPTLAAKWPQRKQ